MLAKLIFYSLLTQFKLHLRGRQQPSLLYSHTYYLYYYFSYICRMKTVCIILGTVSLTLGIIGIFLPLLPTTPFLLLTAALYFRGSPRLYQWLLNHKCLGPYIRNFRENKAIPLRAKIISLLLMWGTMVYCIFFLIPLTEIKIVLFLVAVGVTWHILSFKTLR